MRTAAAVDISRSFFFAREQGKQVSPTLPLCVVLFVMLKTVTLHRRKPEEVVPQHKRRAVVIFSSLLIAIFACEYMHNHALRFVTRNSPARKKQPKLFQRETRNKGAVTLNLMWSVETLILK